jgi:cell division protein FtsZ
LTGNQTTKNEASPGSQGKKSEITANQKYIEFNIRDEKRKEENEFESLYPGTSKERLGLEKKPLKADCTAMSEEDVDDMENIPAYLRRQLRMNDPRYKKQKSTLSVSSENKISDKNNYIYKNVD